jgi:hypothetical protein
MTEALEVFLNDLHETVSDRKPEVANGQIQETKPENQ